jgi:hypothetical protein
MNVFPTIARRFACAAAHYSISCIGCDVGRGWLKGQSLQTYFSLNYAMHILDVRIKVRPHALHYIFITKN